MRHAPHRDALGDRATEGIAAWLSQLVAGMPGLVPERTNRDGGGPAAAGTLRRFVHDVVTTNPLSRAPLTPVQVHLIELALEAVDWLALAHDRRFRHLDWRRASLVYPRRDDGRAKEGC
jgi:hypothetical protein